MEDGASSSALSKPGPVSESSNDSTKQTHVNSSSSISALPASSAPGFPDVVSQINHVMYPTLVPSLVSIQNQHQPNHGAGLYALPVMPFMGHMVAVSTNTLIPLTYNIPLRTNPGEVERTSEGQGQEARQQQAQQRQVVVRRFQIGIQIDLLLILKLAAVIFVFHQEGSKQRLITLVCFATIIYLYQTGALAPLVRWLTENMDRNALPPQPHHPDRVERGQQVRQEGENMPHPDLGAENINRPVEIANQAAEIQPEQGAVAGINWWGITKEIQLLVVGFLTSLLPGFHPHHD